MEVERDTHYKEKGNGNAQKVEGKVAVKLRTQAFLPRFRQMEPEKSTWTSWGGRQTGDPGAAASGLVPPRYSFLSQHQHQHYP